MAISYPDVTPTEAVTNGAALLDQQASPDWRDRIERDSFDIASSSLCILAQLYDSYAAGIKTLSEREHEDDGSPESVAWGQHHGFLGPLVIQFGTLFDDTEGEPSWHDLQVAWVDYLWGVQV